MIKKINEANAGVKRPLRVSDLQDLWTAINKVNALDTANTFILTGFNDKGDGYFSEGVAVKAGILYYHPDIISSRIAIGDTVYGHQVASVDQRVFDDATTQDFAFNMIAKNTASAVSLGLFSAQRVAQLKVKGTKKEVTGVLSFTIAGATTPTLSFTPDDTIGTGINISSAVTTNHVKFSITDADGIRMNRNFDIMPINTNDMESLFSDHPSLLACASDLETADIIMKWESGVPNPPAVYSYRLKILFNV